MADRTEPPRSVKLPTGASPEQFELAWGVIRELAQEIGPRRPTSAAERRAAELVAERLRELGATPGLEPIRGVSTFAWAQAVPLALALLRPGPLALVLALAEGDLRLHALTRAVSRRPSVNVVAEIEPRGPAERAVCLVSHLDSSRSGLLFHPRLAPWLRRLLDASALALVVQSGARFLRRSRVGRLALLAARAYAAFGLGLLLERELRGRDVPGANDNASGVAAAVATAGGLIQRPLERTRVVFLATGCEESGTIGARSFLESHETRDWLFLNLDGVAAPATLRYLPREGVGRVFRADAGLLRACERVAQ